MNTLKSVIDNFLIYLKSAHTTQKYLAHCYQQLGIANVEAKSYENSYRFLYYLEHSQTFYATASQTSLITQPILSFYGMIHLLKACLLTVRPNYPENTSMLAHGVSTRKRKKQQYAFLQDEVKVQQNGLYPYLSYHLFQIDKLDYDKIDMNRLLATIPEMNDLYYLHRGEHILTKISNQDNFLYFPDYLLDHHHVTANLFTHKLKQFTPTIIQATSQNNYVKAELEEPLFPSCNGPYFYHLDEASFYFPSKRHYLTLHNEVMNHYLLLYNLSMISRYETEWWGDLLHTMASEDYPFICKFLAVTNEKIPYLLGYYLYKKAKGIDEMDF